MKINNEMIRQLTLVAERKVLTDDIKVLEKCMRNLGKRIVSLNESDSIEIRGDINIIHKEITDQIKELKKVLKANELL